MEVLTINVARAPEVVAIGNARENIASEIAFDYSPWVKRFGEGTCYLHVQRPQDANPYEAVLEEDETSGRVIWRPTNADTDFTGRGRAQFVFMSGEVKARSVTFYITSAGSLDATGDPPEPWETWMDALEDLADETTLNAREARSAANAAAQSAEAADNSAAAALQSESNAKDSEDAAKTSEETAAAQAQNAGSAAATAAAAATDAQRYAANAAASASSAESSASAADNSRAAAASAAQTAGQAASNANSYASTAAAKATEASGSAATAAQKASDASASATAAASSATSATSAASNAASSATSASTSATNAGNAQTAAEAAQTAAEAAKTAAETAQGKAEDAQEAAETAAQSIEDSAAQIDENTAGLVELRSALDTKAGILRDTVSGAIASFVPDSTVPNLLGLDVHLEPIQDLHGYDSPWPAGGGKNKADYPAMIAAGAVEQSDGSLYVAIASSFSNTKAYQHDGSSGQIAVTFTYKNASTSRGLFPSIVYTDGTRDVLPVNVGSTTFTTVTKVSNGSKTVDYVLFGYGSNVRTWFYIQVESGTTSTSWTPYSNICPISGRDSVTVNANGTTHTISLPETIYGGDIGVVSGDGESEMGMVDMGSLSWSYYAASEFMYCVLPLIKRDSTRVVCSAYPLADNSLSFGIRVVGNVLRIYGTKYTDASTFASDMAGEQLCYELATPTPISTTPTEISTVEGQNNVFSPDGDVTVEYAADLKTYIDNKIAAAVAAMS